MSISLLEVQKIDSWHDLISTHNNLQLASEELCLPTRSPSMTHALPSLESNSGQLFEPPDAQTAIAQVALAVAMAQGQKVCSLLNIPITPLLHVVVPLISFSTYLLRYL